MTTVAVYEALKDAYHNEDQLKQALGKLLQFKLEDERRRLAEYERDLRIFEEQYEMDSAEMNEKFESGDLGDAMDFFEWSGLYEIYLYLRNKIERLERVS